MNATSSVARVVATITALLLFSLSAFSLPELSGGYTGGFCLHSETELSPTVSPNDPDRYHLAIAYNTQHREFLVVWHNNYLSGGHAREIVAQRLDSRGNPIGVNFSISTGAGDRLQPAVAYDSMNDEYMVIWMFDSLGDGKKYDLWGVRLSYTGVPIGAPFLVISVDNRSFWSPQLAWDQVYNEYMVVWGTLFQDTQVASDIGIKMLDHVGNNLYATILSGAGYPTNPDVAWDPVNLRYLVVWNYLNTSGKQVVGGDLRDDLGNRIRLVDVFGSTTEDALFPKVANSMGLFYMVTFELVNSSTDHDIWIAYIGQDATGSIPTGLVTGETNDTHPSVAGNQEWFEFMVNYQRANVTGAQVKLMPVSSYLPLESIDVCNFVFNDCLEPAVLYGGRTYLNAYLTTVMPAQADLAAQASQAEQVDQASRQPETPVYRRHVFSRPFFARVIYLPVVRK